MINRCNTLRRISMSTKKKKKKIFFFNEHTNENIFFKLILIYRKNYQSL